MRSVFLGLSNSDTRPGLKPEERLLLAVVESAYWDLQSPDPGKRRTATSYFLDDRDHHTFSFVAICQHFSWSPGSIRYRLSDLLKPAELEALKAFPFDTYKIGALAIEHNFEQPRRSDIEALLKSHGYVRVHTWVAGPITCGSWVTVSWSHDKRSVI